MTTRPRSRWLAPNRPTARCLVLPGRLLRWLGLSGLAPHRRAQRGLGRGPRGRADLAVAAARLLSADAVVVDVETTGWLADAASITEIGAVRLAGGRHVAEFSALVNPGVPIPAHITALTGISDEMVAGAPAIRDVLPSFLEFASGGVIVAHNAPFDIGFLTAACVACDITWPPYAVIDTAALARFVLRPGEVTDHKLTTLADHFGACAWPRHRALADARATAAVLTGLLALMAPAARTGDCGRVPVRRR